MVAGAVGLPWSEHLYRRMADEELRAQQLGEVTAEWIVAIRRALWAGRRSLPPWPRFRVVMARNRGVNDPGVARAERPRAPFKDRSRHGFWCPLLCHGRGPEVGRFRAQILADLRLSGAEAQDGLGDLLVSTNYVEQRDDTYMIGGTRVSLDSIVHAFVSGDSAETIAQAFPVLNLEQVYGAITFYLAHREEVDRYLAARQRDFDAQREASRKADPMFYQKLADAKRQIPLAG